MSEDNIRSEIAELRKRIERLEGRYGPEEHGRMYQSLAQAVDERIERLGNDGPKHAVGEIIHAAYIRIPRRTWQEGDIYSAEKGYSFEDLQATSPDALARSLNGLAHPVRIAIFKALIGGSKESVELIEEVGLNTTGQLYHHLRIMEDVGLVERRSRNQWTSSNLAAFVFMLAAAKMLAEWREDQ